MKNFKLFKKLLVLAIVLLTWNAHVYADNNCGWWDDNGAGVTFVVDGSSTKNWNDIDRNGVSDYNIGTVKSSLQLKSCWGKLWGQNKMTEVRIHYRVKERDAATGPSYSSAELYFDNNFNTNDQYWQATAINDDLDIALAPGNYEVEFYFQIHGYKNSGYTDCAFLANGNCGASGGNYHANFSIPSKSLSVSGAANGNTVSGAQSGITIGTAYTITATPVAGYKFNGWTATSGSSSVTIADASSPTTTVTFSDYKNNATVTASFVQTYGFIEGRFKVKDATRSTTTYTKSDGVWQTASTAIAMDKDNTNHRFYKHTYCTPAQLAELIGTQTGEGEKNPYFFVSASTASNSVTSPLEYWATSNSSNNDKLLAAGTAGRKAVTNTGGYAFTFMGNSTSTGYAIIYSDKDYIWYELEHDINYDANGGSGDAPTPVYFNNNTDATVGNNVYSRSGYKFKWWNKSSAGTGEDFYPGEKFNITANTDLYAVWEQVASGYAYWNGNDGGSGSPIDVTGNGVTMRLTKNSVDYNTGIKDYTVVSKYNGTTEKHADVLAMDAANEYLQIHFTDGSAINALELGTVHNGTSGTKKVTVIYSTTADFSSGEHEEIEVSIPNSYQSAKGTTDFSPSTNDKYFYARIYRSVSTAVYSYTGPSSGGADKMRIYSIKAQKGCSPHGLAYGTATVNKTYGDAAFTNALTNGHSLTVSYSSGDDDVATVNISNGQVTIKGAGSTTITATWAGSAAYCEGTASYTLNVAKKAISASLSYDETTLTVGDDSSSPTLTGNTDSGAVTWESSDEDVATVDEYGVVTAVGAGTATITATIAATDNYLGDEVSVEFTINPACSAPTSPSVSPANGWIYVPGEAITLTASATGTDASTTYTWYKGPDLATAKASGAIQASKTSAQGGTTYSIASCTVNDAYRYWCEISNGSGCEASASYDINIYRFHLYDDGGDDVSNSAFASIDRTNNKISVDVALEEADYTYQFKVTNGLGTWYGKDESTITSSTNYVNGLTSSGDNVGLTTTCGGCDYTIEYYYNTNNVVVTYPVAYDITHSDAENGTYTIKVGSEDAVSTSTTSFAGATITLAATPDSHYKLQAWNVTKTSSGEAVSMATANTFVMPAEAVTIAPTFGRVYTVSFYTHGGSSQASIEQSSVGGAITMPAAPTYAGHEFVNWVIGGETVAAGAEYTPTEDVTAHATWKTNCAGGGSEPVVLFSQNFDDATAIAYGYTSGSDPVVHTYNVNAGTPTTLSGLVGSGTNLFTSLASSIKQGDIALNTKNGGNSVDVSGFFQAYAKGNNTAYWSLTRTTDFAATAPKALQVSMDIWYCNGSSGDYQAVQFAIGDGFTDALNSTTAQANSNVHSGFGIKANSTATLTAYGDKSTNIYSTGITQSTWLSITWVINNTGSDFTYNNPTGSGTTTLANDKFDIWLKTQAGAASTYTKVVSARAAITEGKDLQNIYIGHNVSGKQHEFRLDNIVVTDLNASGSSCYYITYDGNGADAGSVNDDRAYSSGDNVYVSTCDLSSNFTREGYEFNGWNNKADGSGTYYNYWTNSDKVVITKDTTLYAQWKIVVDEDNENLSGFDTPQYKDVVVRNGAKLTITQNMSVRNITVESGSTLHVAKNGEEGITLSIDSLSLVGGYYTKKDYSTVYDMPRVYIDPLSTLSRTNSTINFDIAVTNQYHPIAVPFPVKMRDVKYADPTVDDAIYGTHYIIKTYDGAARANGSSSCWTFVSNLEYNAEKEEFEDIYLQPGRGYILAAMRRVGKLYEFIRFPMKNVPSAWTTLGEQGTVADVTKNVVAVEAYRKDGDTDGSKTPNANKGWNILGVPFMSRYQATDDIIQPSTGIIQGHFDYSTNKWVDDKIRYVTVPTYDFSEYNQYSIEDDGTVLLPGWCFFVQVETSGNLKFLSEAEAEAAKDQAMPIYAPKRDQERTPTVKTGIILSGAEASDKTTILVSDKYSAADYEINADLEKMFGDNGYTLATYTLSGETRLAYNAMSNADAANIIPIGYRAPADGEYTFSINPRYAESEAFEHVNLIDYETGIMTDLLMGSYTFSTERTQLDTRFALNVVPRQNTPTDIEDVQGDDVQGTKVRKLLINDKMYIIVDGKMYDATGKAVK